jgi:hypothetical protein
VGNGVIGWLVISQKRLNFGMKRHCKIQDKMVCNGLGNRCSIQMFYTHFDRLNCACNHSVTTAFDVSAAAFKIVVAASPDCTEVPSGTL